SGEPDVPRAPELLGPAGTTALLAGPASRASRCVDCSLIPMAAAQTIDEYIESFDPPARDLLVALRGLASDAVPRAAEAVRWRNPAWVHPSGTILFAISGHRHHANIMFTPSTKEAFHAELADYQTGKGSVKLPYDIAIPADLL